MKGITPIISTIVLLLITVALAGAAWVYMSGFLGTYTEKSFIIPTGGAYCDSTGQFHVRVVNSGTTKITAGDWISAEVSNKTGTTGTVIALVKSEVATKGNVDLTNSSDTGKGQSGTSYTITIGTIAGLQQFTITCP
jgi:flagellin-like protein